MESRPSRSKNVPRLPALEPRLFTSLALAMGALIALVSVACPAAPVAAATVDYGSNGNCNGWEPHGWAWTDYSNGSVTDNAGLASDLQYLGRLHEDLGELASRDGLPEGGLVGGPDNRGQLLC